MTFMDKLKSKAEEFDLQGKADRLADENRDKVERVLDKAGAAIDERTEGKYAIKVARAKQQVSKGVDKLAEQRPSQGEMPPTPTDPPI